MIWILQKKSSLGSYQNSSIYTKYVLNRCDNKDGSNNIVRLIKHVPCHFRCFNYIPFLIRSSKLESTSWEHINLNHSRYKIIRNHALFDARRNSFLSFYFGKINIICAQYSITYCRYWVWLWNMGIKVTWDVVNYVSNCNVEISHNLNHYLNYF